MQRDLPWCVRHAPIRSRFLWFLFSTMKRAAIYNIHVQYSRTILLKSNTTYASFADRICRVWVLALVVDTIAGMKHNSFKFFNS